MIPHFEEFTWNFVWKFLSIAIDRWNSGRVPPWNVSKKNNNNTYFTSGYLFPETESAVHAIQDQVVPTRYY